MMMIATIIAVVVIAATCAAADDTMMSWPSWLDGHTGNGNGHDLIAVNGGWQTRAHDWSSVDLILDNAIKTTTFPGCVAIVADRQGILYAKPHGSMTYGIAPPFSGGVNPPMTMDTRFDMASCTKVLASTTAIALLYQWGHISLDTLISDASLLGPDFAAAGKQDITVRHCLLHNAGFPPDPNPNYWEKKFGCPETQHANPEENFTCRERIWQSLMKQTLLRPVNVAYNYSDLSLITLGFVVGRVAHRDGLINDGDLLPNCLVTPEGEGENAPTRAAIYQCYFEAFVRKHVIDQLSLKRTGFLPDRSVWGECAPAENNTLFVGRPIQGQVSDGNTYAMGGIAGHAGLFSTAPEVMAIMREWLFNDHASTYLNATTTSLFVKEWNHTQSSRALGWNTNDAAVFDAGWNLSCGKKLSAATYTHTGYTGTQVCADPLFPTGPLLTILLTNRVYPTDTTGTTKIHDTRQAYNDQVYTILTQSHMKEEMATT